MEFDHSGKYLFVADMWGQTPDKASITVMSGEDLKPIKKINLPNGYYSANRQHANGYVEVTITPDNRFALITRLQGCRRDGCGGMNKGIGEQVDGLLVVLDIQSLKPVMYVPTGGSGSKIIGIKPNSNIVYVTNWFTHDVSVINITKAYSLNPGSPQLVNKALVKKISFPRRSAPRGVAFNKDGSFMYVMGFTSRSIYVVNTKTNRIFATLPGPQGLNFRHMVTNRLSTVGYFSHMIGNAISRIDLVDFNNILSSLDQSKNNVLSGEIWKKIMIPWKTRSGLSNILILSKYPKDHPEAPLKIYGRADPNTIVLDSSNECYLYVSFRSAGINGGGLRNGKIDAIDVCRDRRIFSLISGEGPTALAATKDGSLLASSGFFDNTIYFFDIGLLKSRYENIYNIQ